MSARNLRKASTFCVLAVAAGYFHSRHSSTCRGSLPNLAFRSSQGRAESTAMNAGFMDIFKGAVGTKGTWSAEEFQRMVKAIESSAQTTIDIVPNWDDLEVILRGQETAAERAKEDTYLAGEGAECSRLLITFTASNCCHGSHYSYHQNLLLIICITSVLSIVAAASLYVKVLTP